jgi:hypothetical protein
LLTLAVPVLLGVFCPVFPGEGKASEENPLERLLPAAHLPGGWTREGDSQYFAGEDLYIYIDGGAEIYLEYGFSGVIVQDYKDDAGSRISLEIFEMQSPDAAYGMYTFKKGPHGRAVDLGDRGQWDDYYFNFCKGRYLATITSLDQAEAAQKGGLAIGRAVDALIGEPGTEPGLVARLPKENLRPHSIKYFRGRLGVSNSLPLLAKAAAGILDGALAETESGRTVCIFQYPDRESALQKWAEAKDPDTERAQAVRTGDAEPVLFAGDDKGVSYFARLEDKSIYFIIGRLNPAEAGEALARLIGWMNRS